MSHAPSNLSRSFPASGQAAAAACTAAISAAVSSRGIRITAVFWALRVSESVPAGGDGAAAAAAAMGPPPARCRPAYPPRQGAQRCSCSARSSASPPRRRFGHATPAGCSIVAGPRLISRAGIAPTAILSLHDHTGYPYSGSSV
eukprot:SAG22_NODE_799_length_7128_cov_14.224356_4_plen_144_part_00